MATTGLKVENQNLSTSNLQCIQWSEKSISLCDFVTTYPLPQIVQIKEGFHGGLDENSLSMGQVLKIHTLTTERKLLCQDRHGKELHIPVHTQKVYLKPENYDTVYQSVQDLSHVKPLPKYVEVSRGYYNVDSDVNYELSVEPGEILEVIEVNESNIFTKKNRNMAFRNSEGIVVKIPFDCVAGFKPLIDNTPHLLSDIVPSETNNYKFPIYFQIHGSTSSKIGVVKAKSVYDDHLIIASCGEGHSQVVFMIPQDLKVKVKVAVGTLQDDPEYEDIRRSYHNFKTLETDLRKSKSFRGRMGTKASEIVGFPIVKRDEGKPNEWVTFEHDEECGELNESKPLIPDSERKDSVSTANDGGLHLSMDERIFRRHHPQPLNNQIPVRKYVPYRSSSMDSGGRNSLQGNDFSINVPPMYSQSTPSPPPPEVDKYKEIREMTVQQLAEALKSLNMEKHVNVFVENQVDGELFLHLEDDELRELNSLNKFEIKKLNRFKEGWRPKLE